MVVGVAAPPTRLLLLPACRTGEPYGEETEGPPVADVHDDGVSGDCGWVFAVLLPVVLVLVLVLLMLLLEVALKFARERAADVEPEALPLSLLFVSNGDAGLEWECSLLVL